MKRETKDSWVPVLADMHTDGVRFDKKQASVDFLHNQVRSAEVIQGRNI
jgi:hypothetical protein